MVMATVVARVAVRDCPQVLLHRPETLAALALMAQMTSTKLVEVVEVQEVLVKTQALQTAALVEWAEQCSVSPMARAGAAVFKLPLRLQMVPLIPEMAALVVERQTLRGGLAAPALSLLGTCPQTDSNKNNIIIIYTIDDSMKLKTINF
jgi:hypothetical protein